MLAAYTLLNTTRIYIYYVVVEVGWSWPRPRAALVVSFKRARHVENVISEFLAGRSRHIGTSRPDGPPTVRSTACPFQSSRSEQQLHGAHFAPSFDCIMNATTHTDST